MAEKPTTKPGFENPEKHNQEVAQQLLKQDLVNTPAELETAGDALDALAATVPDPSKVEPKVEPKTEPKAGEPEPKVEPVTPDATIKAAAEAKAKADAETVAKDTAEKFFKDTPGLPPGSSPKASEAFSSIKIKAAQELSAREARIEKLEKEKLELETKLKDPVPPEILKELEDHRTWRAKLDVAHDPKFKTFDKTITDAQDFIYAQLKKSPVVTEEVIAQIKKIGGPEKVDLTKIFAAINDPTMQKLVDAKVADIEMANFQKEQAIKLTQDNVNQYVAERGKHFADSANAHTVATQQRVEPMLKQLDWTTEKSIDPKADEATRKSAEEHNAFVKQTKEQLAAALQDDSAEMRAILLVGMAQLFNTQRVNASMKSELETVKKNLSDITEKYDKVKSSSTTRLRESGAPSGGIPQIKKADQFNAHPGDALDSIAKQVMEERAAKAAA